MKIYTRTGDQGSTGLFGGGRVAKSDTRICAIGAVDETNAVLGVARAIGLSSRVDEALELLQNRMFDLGAELASPQAGGESIQLLEEEDVVRLESLIDKFEEGLPELKAFILPGGTQAASMLHMARSVCRRAEREMVALAEASAVREVAITYINRASDLLFVLARTVNAESGHKDVPWAKKSES